MQRRKATRNGSEGLKATSAEKAQTSASTRAWCRIGLAGTTGTFPSGHGELALDRVRLRGAAGQHPQRLFARGQECGGYVELPVERGTSRANGDGGWGELASLALTVAPTNDPMQLGVPWEHVVTNDTLLSG